MKNTAICIGCVVTKLRLHHKFPIRCPKLKMPCAMIKSEIVIDKLMREGYRRWFIRSYINGIPDTDFNILDKKTIDYIKQKEKEIINNKGKQAINYVEYGTDGFFMPMV